MANWLRTALMCLVVVAAAAPAMAQEGMTEEELAAQAHERAVEMTRAEGAGLKGIGLAVGAGMVILGAGLGIGRIGGQAVEAMSRQPEAAANIQTGMIIAAALIEGAAFFGLIILGFIISG